MRQQLHIITDLQYGSTGKGLFAGYLASEVHPDTIITAWGPNAGHTFVNESGDKFITCALPSGIFTAPDLKQILIGPGSVINPEHFLTEMEQYEQFLHGVKIIIHPYAAIVREVHRQLEKAGSLSLIGSTLKGVSEAMIDKLRRRPVAPNVAAWALVGTPLELYVVSVDEYNDAMDAANVAILEGAQGFSLSINHGFYPYTTSRDCTTAQLLVDCGIPCGPGLSNCEVIIYGVARTYPIRVNNRDGSSGPCYDDQQETTFEAIGQETEFTTVTRLPRRIFTFSEKQIRDAVRMNGVDRIFLNFANYMKHDLPHLIETVNKYAPVEWLGFGASISDIVPSNAEHGGEVGKFAGVNG